MSALRRTLARCSCVASCLALDASCAATDELRAGIGGRGTGAVTVESWWESEAEGEHHGILIDGSWYDFHGRAADVTASIGVESVQAIAGYEWSHKGDESFQAQLYGVRAMVGHPEQGSGPYVILLGRAVLGSEARTPFFDGLDLGIGFLGRLKGALFGDVSLSWGYVDGDAIGPGTDSLSELRLALGLRFEF